MEEALLMMISETEEEITAFLAYDSTVQDGEMVGVLHFVSLRLCTLLPVPDRRLAPWISTNVS